MEFTMNELIEEDLKLERLTLLRMVSKSMVLL